MRKVIGWSFLISAFIVLLIAFTMKGVESWREARLVLIMFGVVSTFLGGSFVFKKKVKT